MRKRLPHIISCSSSCRFLGICTAVYNATPAHQTVHYVRCTTSAVIQIGVTFAKMKDNFDSAGISKRGKLILRIIAAIWEQYTKSSGTSTLRMTSTFYERSSVSSTSKGTSAFSRRSSTSSTLKRTCSFSELHRTTSSMSRSFGTSCSFLTTRSISGF